MSELKTKAGTGSVSAFLKKLDLQKRQDSEALIAMMKRTTRADAVMWGTSIIGFGHRHYVYESGREGDWFQLGFSPRKAALTIYGLGLDRHEAQLAKLGKCTRGKGCLYVKRLSDVDVKLLGQLMRSAVQAMP